MRVLKIILFAIAVTLFSGVASAQINKETITLCSGDGTDCTTPESTVNWKQNTWVEFSIDDSTGCNANATYQILARNASGVGDFLIATLSTNSISSQVFIPLQWYRDWLVSPSSLTGCTSLVIVMHIVRS